MKKLFNDTVYLDFYTDSPTIQEYFPISPSRNYIPSWWKKMPSSNGPHDRKRNIKRCSGFMDLFKNTYTVPLSTEILVDIKDNDYYIEPSDNSFNIDQLKSAHPPHQRESFLPEPTYSHVKIPVRWAAVSSNDLDIIVVPPTWVNDPLFVNTINVLSASKNLFYDTSMHWHFMLNKQEDQVFTIEPDTPMYYFAPLTDKKVVVRTHYDPKKYDELQNYLLISSFGFNSNFYKMKKFMSERLKK